MKTYFYQIDANVCKNDRCDNLGVSFAPEYISPSYNLGFPALYCEKCGSNAPLLDNHDINTILNNHCNLYLTQIEKRCPHCYSQDIIRYGYTQKKTPRLKCNACHLVHSHSYLSEQQKDQLSLLADELFRLQDFKLITKKLAISYSQLYPLLKKLAQLCKKNKLQLEQNGFEHYQHHISTRSNTFKVKGKTSPAELWNVTSSLSNTGYILLSSLNYTEHEVSKASMYDTQIPYPLVLGDLSNIANAALREYLFFNRPHFDQLSYHHKPITFIYPERILTPVICAYAHFYELKQYYPSLCRYHYLEHEIVLRSAAITVFGQEVQQQKCHIMYFCENLPKLSNKIITINKHVIGWWKNEWFDLKDNNQNSICLFGILTNRCKPLSNQELIALPATFVGINDFYLRFEHYFPEIRLNKLSAGTIQLLFTIFTSYYNFCLMDHNQTTPAQRAGITNKAYCFDEFINLSQLN